MASEHGRLTGVCCFCNRKLTDERSTAVGYGKICAGHYGLPWGADTGADLFTGPAEGGNPEAEMQRMEAEADREGTTRDEANKHRARSLMELAAAFPQR